MALRLQIPEAAALRALAASLATALATERQDDGDLDFRQSAGFFLRTLPWSGQRRTTKAAPRIDNSTVAQYFRHFNWEGLVVQRVARMPKAPVPRSDTEPLPDVQAWSFAEKQVIAHAGDIVGSVDPTRKGVV